MNTIKVYINGEEKEISIQTTVQDILDEMKTKSSMLVVEKNLEIIPKEDYSNNILKDGDKLEIVGFFGGG